MDEEQQFHVDYQLFNAANEAEMTTFSNQPSSSYNPQNYSNFGADQPSVKMERGKSPRRSSNHSSGSSNPGTPYNPQNNQNPSQLNQEVSRLSSDSDQTFPLNDSTSVELHSDIQSPLNFLSSDTNTNEFLSNDFLSSPHENFDESSPLNKDFGLS